ncbi:hypothetical protein SFRURICE_016549 [Spodoptera frugiperda]|nr:hypothetical protein SFRURICE_016549 [Spodoptera frugiperda]
MILDVLSLLFADFPRVGVPPRWRPWEAASLPRVARMEHYANAYSRLYSGRLTPPVSRPQAFPMEVVDRLPPHGADDWRVYGGREKILIPINSRNF